MRNNLAVHIEFSYPAGDELRILGPEVNDENGVGSCGQVFDCIASAITAGWQCVLSR